MYVEEKPANPKEEKIIRVAAYARVSADKDAAFHSLEAQEDYYHAYIQNHPSWVLADIYSDAPDIIGLNRNSLRGKPV